MVFNNARILRVSPRVSSCSCSLAKLLLPLVLKVDVALDAEAEVVAVVLLLLVLLAALRSLNSRICTARRPSHLWIGTKMIHSQIELTNIKYVYVKPQLLVKLNVRTNSGRSS